MTKHERDQVYSALDSLKAYLMAVNKLSYKDQIKIIDDLIVIKLFVEDMRN